MSLESIIDKGLDEGLSILRDLKFYSTSELKKEEFNIIHQYDMDYMLYKFQHYIKSLPAPGISLNLGSRVIIYNTRNILEGLSIITDMHQNHLTRLYSNWLRVRERNLVPHLLDSAKTKKPRDKTAKTRKVKPIPNVTEIHDVELSVIREEEDTFGEVILPDGGDDSRLLQRHSHLLSSLFAPATKLSADLLSDFSDHLRESTHRPPEISGTDLVHSQERLLLPEQPLEVERLLVQTLTQRPSIQQELPHTPTLTPRPSIQQLDLDLENIIQDIGKDPAKRKGQRRPKRSKFIFRERPTMTTEEYARFLTRRKQDAVKYYSKKGVGDSVAPSERTMLEHELIDHGLHDLLQIPKKKIPIPINPLYLKERPRIITDSGRIPEFELVTEMPADVTYDARRSEVPERNEIDEYERQSVSEQLLQLAPSRDSRYAPEILATYYQDEVEDIGNLLSLMNALSLDGIQKMNVVSELLDFPSLSKLPSYIAPSLSKIVTEHGSLSCEPLPSEGSPLVKDQEGERVILPPPEHGFLTDVQSSIEIVDKIFSKITEECSTRETQVIRFTDICSLSKIKLVAAKVFVHLMDLCAQKLISLNQTSSHPDDIFIVLIQ